VEQRLGLYRTTQRHVLKKPIPTGKLKGRALKSRVFELLASENLHPALDALVEMPARQVINPLFGLLLSTDPRIKWHAVTAFGAVVSPLADQDMESARVIMRRLMWQLNDESGGIGWGCPEAMGEITACHGGLALEYSNALISYVTEDGNFLEYEPLQRGAVWGIARLAQVRRRMVMEAVPHLLSFLAATDSTLRGLAVWALGLLGAREARSGIDPLIADTGKAEIYMDRRLEILPVSDLAQEALARIS